MIGIRIIAIAADFCINPRAALQSMLQGFQNHNTCAFAHNKACTVFIKRTGSFGRLVIACRQRFHRAKASYRCRRNAGFHAASHHYVGIAALNDFKSVAYGIRACSASRNYAARRSAQAKSDRGLASRHIGDHHRYKERADTAGSFIKQGFILIVQRINAANTGADYRTNALQVFFLQVQGRIFNRHGRSRNSKLRYPIHAFCFFFVNVLCRFKALDFTGNAGRKIAGVKTSNRTNAGNTVCQGLPKFSRRIAYRGNSPQTGDYYAFGSSMQIKHLTLVNCFCFSQQSRKNFLYRKNFLNLMNVLASKD